MDDTASMLKSYRYFTTYVSPEVQFPQHATFAAPRGAYALQLLRKLADIRRLRHAPAVAASRSVATQASQSLT